MVLKFFSCTPITVEIYGVDAIKCRLEDLIAVGGHGLRNTDFSGEPSSIHAIGAVPLPDLHLFFDGDSFAR